MCTEYNCLLTTTSTIVQVFASTVTGKPKNANVNLTGIMYRGNDKLCRSSNKTKSLGPFYQDTNKYGIATFQICMACRALEVKFQVISNMSFTLILNKRGYSWSLNI